MKFLIISSVTIVYAFTDLRQLYTLSSTGTDCQRCIRGRKNHCWGFVENGSGSWTRGYCCGPSDTKCNSLEFCSNDVSNSDLKTFTCPVDQSKCPSGSGGILKSTSFDTITSKRETWSSSSIR